MNKYVLSIRDILMCTTVHVVIQLKTVHFKFQTWDTFEELATLKINWPFNLYMFRIDYLICFTFFTLIYLFEINSYCQTDQTYVSRKFERPFTTGGGMSIDMQSVLTFSPKIQGDPI